MRISLIFAICVLVLFAFATMSPGAYAETGSCSCETPDGISALEGSALFLAIESMSMDESPQMFVHGCSNGEVEALKDEIVSLRTADPAPLSLAEFWVLSLCEANVETIGVTPDGRIASEDDYLKLFKWSASPKYLRNKLNYPAKLTDLVVELIFLEGQGKMAAMYVLEHPVRFAQAKELQDGKQMRFESPWWGFGNHPQSITGPFSDFALEWYFGSSGNGNVNSNRISGNSKKTGTYEPFTLPEESMYITQFIEARPREFIDSLAGKILAERISTPAPLTEFEYSILHYATNIELKTIPFSPSGDFVDEEELERYYECLNTNEYRREDVGLPLYPSDILINYHFLGEHSASAKEILAGNPERAAEIRKAQVYLFDRMLSAIIKSKPGFRLQ